MFRMYILFFYKNKRFEESTLFYGYSVLLEHLASRTFSLYNDFPLIKPLHNSNDF